MAFTFTGSGLCITTAFGFTGACAGTCEVTLCSVTVGWSDDSNQTQKAREATVNPSMMFPLNIVINCASLFGSSPIRKLSDDSETSSSTIFGIITPSGNRDGIGTIAGEAHFFERFKSAFEISISISDTITVSFLNALAVFDISWMVETDSEKHFCSLSVGITDKKLGYLPSVALVIIVQSEKVKRSCWQSFPVRNESMVINSDGLDLQRVSSGATIGMICLLYTSPSPR